VQYSSTWRAARPTPLTDFATSASQRDRVGLLGCDGDVAADLGRGDVDGAGGFVEAIDGARDVAHRVHCRGRRLAHGLDSLCV
jgi:hypothetical protein